MKNFPIEECARIAYGDQIPQDVVVEHVEQLSVCRFITKKGNEWRFVYDHVTESFILCTNDKVLSVRHQKRLFDFINSYYDQSNTQSIEHSGECEMAESEGR